MSSKVSGGGCYVCTVDVVVSDNLIGVGIKNDLDSYVNPAGEAVSINSELTKRGAVEASEFGLAVSCGHYAEYGIVDSPLIAPTDAGIANLVNSVVNELHFEVNVSLSIKLECKVTNGVRTSGEAGELVCSAVCRRQPHLKLLLSASLCISSDELKVTVLHYGVVRTVSGVNGVVLRCVSVHTVVVGTVGVIEGFYYEAVVTYRTVVGKSRTGVVSGDVMSYVAGSALNVATYSTSRCYCTSGSSIGVTESRTLSMSTCGTGLGSGTGRSLHGVTCRISEVTVLELGTSGMITFVNGVTAHSTCGSDNLSCNKVTFVEVNATYGTYVVIVGLVSERCIFYVLGVKYLLTYGTVGFYVVRTAVYTVGSNNVNVSGCFGVAESGRTFVNKSTSGAVLSVFAISVYPSVLVLVEEPLRVLLVTEEHIINCEAGTGSGPTTHIEVVDVEVQDGLLSLGVKKVVSIGVYERVVDVVADGKNAILVDLDEHLDVNPISTINGSEYVGGYVITGNFEGTVAVRRDAKDVKGVSAPTVGGAESLLVFIPVRIVTGGHDDNTHGLGDSTGLHTEGEYTKGFVGCIPTGHSVSMVLIVGGTVDHVLRFLLACLDRVRAVYDRNGGITVLGEEEVRLIITGVGDKLIGGEGVVTCSTCVSKCSTVEVRYGSMGSNCLALSRATSICTSGGIIASCRKHIVAKSGDISSGLSLSLYATNGTLGNVVSSAFIGTSGKSYSLGGGLAGSMSCKITGGSLTFLTSSKSLTGSLSVVVLEHFLVSTTALTSPLVTTKGVSGHLVSKSSAFVGYGALSSAFECTVSGLSTVNAALLSAFVVSVVLELVVELIDGEMLGGCDLVTLQTSDNHIVATGSCTGCRMIILLHCNCALGVMAKSCLAVLSVGVATD